MNTQAKPLYFKTCSVPYSLRQKVEQELEKLEWQDVITPAPLSDWATPIVLVGLRVTGLLEYAVITNNKVSKTDMYPLPRIEDLFSFLICWPDIF